MKPHEVVSGIGSVLFVGGIIAGFTLDWTLAPITAIGLGVLCGFAGSGADYGF